MVLESKLVSVYEFLALPEDGNRHELVQGEGCVMPPPKGKHGFIETFSLLLRRIFLAPPGDT